MRKLRAWSPANRAEPDTSKVRVGPAETGLLDAHFVPAVGQPHGADIFQLHVLKIEREAGEICFHGERFWTRTKSRDVKMAVHQAVAIQPGKMQRRDEKWIEIDSLGSDLRRHRIIAPEPDVQLSGKPPRRHRRIDRCAQVVPIRIHFPVKASHHVIAQFQVNQAQRGVQFRRAQRSLSVGLQIEAASHGEARHLDFVDRLQRNRRAREVKCHVARVGVIVEIARHNARGRARRMRRQAHLGVGDSHFAACESTIVRERARSARILPSRSTDRTNLQTRVPRACPFHEIARSAARAPRRMSPTFFADRPYRLPPG